MIGHSHVAAIRNAAILRRQAEPDRPRTRTIYLLDPAFGGEMAEAADPPRFSDGVTAAIRDQVRRHCPIVASAIGGNAHAAMTLIAYRRFDFALRGDDEADAALPIDRGGEILHEDEVRAMLTAALAPDLLRLGLLRAIAGPFRHLESPPPVRDAQWIVDHAEKFFTDQPAFHTLGVAGAGVRYRTWRLAGRIVRERCEALGCAYVPVPKHVCGAAGLLRPSHARDATHGGTQFGEAMIQALEQAEAADAARTG